LVVVFGGIVLIGFYLFLHAAPTMRVAMRVMKAPGALATLGRQKELDSHASDPDFARVRSHRADRKSSSIPFGLWRDRFICALQPTGAQMF
jgi:hypothetical protein